MRDYVVQLPELRQGFMEKVNTRKVYIIDARPARVRSVVFSSLIGNEYFILRNKVDKIS